MSAPTGGPLLIQKNLEEIAQNGTLAQAAARANLGLEGGAGVASFSAGTTGLTPATATDGAVVLAGTLEPASGGTGVNSTSNIPVTATGTPTARTLANRAADVVNVIDYGADPTGVADSSEAFQNAAYDLGTGPNKGGTIFVPTGKYLLNSTIYSSGADTWQLAGNVIMTGAGGIDANTNGGATTGPTLGGMFHQFSEVADNTGFFYSGIVQNSSQGSNFIIVRMVNASTTGAGSVCIETQPYVQAGATGAATWGYHTLTTIPPDSDGFNIGMEIEIHNEGLSTGVINEPTAKIGHHIVARGTVNSTAAIYVNKANSSAETGVWNDGFIIGSGAVNSAGAALAIRNFAGSTPVDVASIKMDGSATFTNVAASGTVTIGSVTTGGVAEGYSLSTSSSGVYDYIAYDAQGSGFNWDVQVVGGAQWGSGMLYGCINGPTMPPVFALTGPAWLSDVTASTVNGMTIGASTGTLALANSSTLTTLGAYDVTFTATSATNVTLPTSGTLITTSAIPASDTLHLLGPTGTAGVAEAVAIGANLSLTGGTLSATSSGSGTVNTGTANHLAYYAGNTATLSSNPLVSISASGVLSIGQAGTTAGSVVLDLANGNNVTVQPLPGGSTWALTLPTNGGTAGQSLRTDGAGTSSWVTQIPASDTLHLLGATGTLGVSAPVTLGTNLSITSGTLNATAGGGGVSSVVGGTGLTGGTITTTGTLAVSYGTTAGTAAQGNDSRVTGALQAAAIPAGTAGNLLVATGTAGQANTSSLLPTAAMPALTGDVTNGAGSLATTVGAIGGHAVSLGGALTLSGAYASTIALTGATSVTIPTSGTLVSTAVTSLPSLATVNGATVPSSGTLTNLGTASTGTGSVVLSTNPVLTTPTLGVATATSVNGLSLTASTGTLAVANGSTLATSGAYSITLTAAAATSVTLPSSGTLVNTTVSTLANLTTVGTISGGTWNAVKISGTYGGTGVNNGASTLTYGGNVTFSGAFTSSFTLTAATALTLPTSGTVTALGNVSTGSGSIVLATSPVLVTPTLGVASATSLTTNATITAAATTGAINYGTLSFSDTNNLEALETNVNSHAQLVIQNAGTGALASSDVVVTNNLSTATTYYGNFGINSSGFSGTGSLSLPNATYLTGTTGDLVLGTTTSNAIHFVANNGTVDAATISAAGELSVNPAVGTIGGLKGALVRGWDSGAVAANGTITLINGAPYGLVINSAVAQMGTGSFVSALSIGGATIGGLGAVTVNGTLSTTSATSSNTLAAGGTLTLAVTSATGSPTNGFYQINTTRT